MAANPASPSADMRAEWPDVLYRDWSSRPPPSGLRWQVPGPEGVNSRPWCASS